MNSISHTREGTDTCAKPRTRPPDDPGNETAPVATEAADTTETYTAKHTAKIQRAQAVSHTLLLARLMPRTAAALLANSATISNLAQVLPVTAAAVSVALR